jgi:hypothetical protein
MPLDDDADRETETIPGFEAGGRVKETGIALVHQGEYILPAPGSEAVIEPVETSGEAVVNYYFPVEVVVVGALTDEERGEVEARIWDSLSEALDRVG